MLGGRSYWCPSGTATEPGHRDLGMMSLPADAKLSLYRFMSSLGLACLMTALGATRVLAFDIEPRMTFEQ